MLLKIQSLMSPQSQMVCMEMARDEKSTRLKFRGCLEISVVGETVRKNKDGLRRTLSEEG